MTPRQKELARHALGLDQPFAKGKSYRNRFFITRNGPDWDDWRKMEIVGHAKKTQMKKAKDGRPAEYLFEMTRSGALLALNEGEWLCKEDFPPVQFQKPTRPLTSTNIRLSSN